MAYEVTVFPAFQPTNGRTNAVPKLPPQGHYPAVALNTELHLTATGECLICLNLNEDIRLAVAGATGNANPTSNDMILKAAASPHWFMIDGGKTGYLKAVAA